MNANASGVSDRFKKALQPFARLLLPAPPRSESMRMNPLFSTSQSANVVLPTPGTPQRINTRGSFRIAEPSNHLEAPCHAYGLSIASRRGRGRRQADRMAVKLLVLPDPKVD